MYTSHTIWTPLDIDDYHDYDEDRTGSTNGQPRKEQQDPHFDLRTMVVILCLSVVFLIGWAMGRTA